MPVAALLALIIAFWLPGEGMAVGTGGGLAAGPLRWLCAVLVGVGGLSAASGRLIAWRLRREGPSGRTRRHYSRLASGLVAVALLAFGALVVEGNWPGYVREGLGLRRWPLAAPCLIFLPFLILHGLVWIGLEPAERLVRQWRGGPWSNDTAVRALALRARRAYGLALPVAVVLALAGELVGLVDPNRSSAPWVDLGSYGLVTAVLVLGSPALVRLTWPTSRLADGPLRRRLERLAGRHRFRFTDILVWDTGGAMVNAGVTGLLPAFRYVLLSDGLIENVEGRQVEAVFGHEVGHVAHRHLAFFAGFFAGSIGLMALVAFGVRRLLDFVEAQEWVAPGSSWGLIWELGLALPIVGAYFLLVFGYVSRRFERQADVFGCRSISCGRRECPPHLDVNAADSANRSDTLCPVAVRTFVDALSTVGYLNGIELESRSWRHGSIGRRLEFIEGLEARPGDEARFQRRVDRMRLAVLSALAATFALAYWTGALATL